MIETKKALAASKPSQSFPNTSGTNSTTDAQCEAIFDYLAAGNHLTILYAYKHLGIDNPVARIRELKELGRDIVTVRYRRSIAAGRLYRSVEFMLVTDRVVV